jgi:hypothetical protein
MTRARKALKVAAGFLLLVVSVLAGGTYRGRYRFYRRIHDQNLAGACVRAFLEFSLLANLYRDYAYYARNHDKDRITDYVRFLYSGASLSGYGNRLYDKGGDGLADQTRGLPLTVIRKMLDQCGGGSSATVVEIGTANGDVLRQLANEYPDLQFIGIDLNVDNARAYNAAENITYIGGYAYDVLGTMEAERRPIDALFAISTFTCTTPLEFLNYMKRIRALEVRHILVSGANMNGYRQLRDADMFSRHMEGHVWFHNYCGYLRAFDYSIRHFEQFHLRHPRADTPDIFWHHIHAELDARASARPAPGEARVQGRRVEERAGLGKEEARA